MSNIYKPFHIRQITESVNVTLKDKRVLIVNAPTTEVVEWCRRQTQSVNLVFERADPLYMDLAYAGDVIALKATRFEGMVMCADVTSFLAATVLHSYDVILWFDFDTTPNAIRSEIMARRALAFHGKLFITYKQMPSGFDQLQQYYYNNEDVTLKFSVIQKEPGFLVCSYPRCGTHMFRSAIQQHPSISINNEVFNPAVAIGSHRFKAVRQVVETYWPNPSCGFIVHAYQGMPGGPLGMSTANAYTNFWADITRNLKVVSIRRRNLLARHVSHLKAKKTLTWNKEDGSGTNNVQVTVDFKKLVADAAYVQKCWRNVDTLYPGCLVMYYEDMVANFLEQFRRAEDYLGIPHRATRPRTVKLGRELHDDVSNFQTLKKHIDAHGGMERFMVS